MCSFSSPWVYSRGRQWLQCTILVEVQQMPNTTSTDGPSHPHRFTPQPWGQQGRVMGCSDYMPTRHSHDSKTHRTRATNMTALLMITSSQRLTKFRYLLTQSRSSFLARSPTKAYQSAAEEENGRVTARSHSNHL